VWHGTVRRYAFFRARHVGGHRAGHARSDVADCCWCRCCDIVVALLLLSDGPILVKIVVDVLLLMNVFF
jgi:hypothetical protein